MFFPAGGQINWANRLTGSALNTVGAGFFQKSWRAEKCDIEPILKICLGKSRRNYKIN
jgi:hypothetical protein